MTVCTLLTTSALNANRCYSIRRPPRQRNSGTPGATATTALNGSQHEPGNADWRRVPGQAGTRPSSVGRLQVRPPVRVWSGGFAVPAAAGVVEVGAVWSARD